MGKKARKTKELWAAIAEAASSTAIDVSGQQESLQPPDQPQATRKRGRPRKIINVVSTEEIGAQQEAIEQQAGSIIAAQSITEEEEKHEGGSASACILRNTKEEGVVLSEEEMQLPKGVPSRSRARRKSKPRKSS